MREARCGSGTLMYSTKCHKEAALGKGVTEIRWETRNAAYPNLCDIFPGILFFFFFSPFSLDKGKSVPLQARGAQRVPGS